MLRKCVVCLGLATVLVFSVVPTFAKPQLQRAKTFTQVTRSTELDVREFWVSEKLDGVRGFWDGETLRSRSGRKIAAPPWFVEVLPKGVQLDGELWIGRGRFDEVSGVVRKSKALEAEWRQVKYCIFDLPAHGGTFDERVAAMSRLVKVIDAGHLQMVEQFKVKHVAHLHAKLAEVVANGGEGLMLHRGSARYSGTRTENLIKMKPVDDAEAVVVAHIAGKGKFQGMLGALVVEKADGKRFRIGTGFSDAERRQPPAVGETITYQHNGFTPNGLPRFARFLRVRHAQ